MKKVCFFVMSVLISMTAVFSQSRQLYQRSSRIELSVWGGYACGGAGEQSLYSDQWMAPLGNFSLIDEKTTLQSKSKNGASIGAGVGYFLSPHLGIELSLGFLWMNVPNTSNYTLTRNDQATGLEQAHSFDWHESGNLEILPFSVNFVFRFGSRRLGGYFSLGPTLFINTYSAEAHMGYAVLSSATIDALKIKLETGSNTWIAPGGNIGAGFVFNFSPMLGASIDARYFLCPSKELFWNARTGNYRGLLNESANYTLGSAEADSIQTQSGLSFNVAPSFFQITAGLKMRI